MDDNQNDLYFEDFDHVPVLFFWYESNNKINKIVLVSKNSNIEQNYLQNE